MELADGARLRSKKLNRDLFAIKVKMDPLYVYWNRKDDLGLDIL